MTDDEMPDLFEHAQRVARQDVAELEGPEDDIMPTFLWFGPHGLGMMPLIPMTDWRMKDRLAVAMTAALAVSRATQAVFVSTSWLVKVDRPPDMPGEGMYDNPLGDLMPSEHPDRQECITIMHMGEGEKNAVAQAILTRYPDKPPDLGEWDTTMSGEGMKVGGRFGEAINGGLAMVQAMPQEMVDIIEEGWRDNEQETLMRQFIKVHSRMTGVARDFGIATFDPDQAGKPVTAQQVSKRFKIPLRTIYEVCKSGVLPARREKGRWMIDQLDAAEYALGYQLRKEESEERRN